MREHGQLAPRAGALTAEHSERYNLRARSGSAFGERATALYGKLATG